MIQEQMVEGLPNSIDFENTPLNCVHCLAGKSTQLPYKRKLNTGLSDHDMSVKNVGDEVVSDTFGPITPIS